MKYINATKGSVVALVVFITIAFVVPGHGPSDSVELVLTISTFLFAILVGFFITRLNNRYDSLIDLVAEEDALWLSLYYTAGTMSKKLQKKFATIIDRYYVIAYDFEIGKYYKQSAYLLKDCYTVLARDGGGHEGSTFATIIGFLLTIEVKRNKTATVSHERLTIGQFTVLIALALIIVYSIFFLRTPDVYLQIISVVFSTVVVLLILIMRDLQNLRLSGKLTVDESGQEVLEAIGKLRYYNKKFLTNGANVVPSTVKKYRLGLHTPGEKQHITIVSR